MQHTPNRIHHSIFYASCGVLARTLNGSSNTDRSDDILSAPSTSELHLTYQNYSKRMRAKDNILSDIESKFDNDKKLLT